MPQMQVQARKDKNRACFQFLNTSPELARNFRAVLRQLQAKSLEDELFDEHESPTGQPSGHYQFPDAAIIDGKFDELNAHYGFFSGKDLQDAKNRFRMYFSACKLTGDYIECNNDPKNELAFRNAYKIAVISDASNADAFSAMDNLMHACQSEKPLHDAFILDLPLNKPPLQDIRGWREFIKKNPVNGLEIFQIASKIEKMNGGKAPVDASQANHLASSIQYARYAEYPKLALLCRQYKLPENLFDRCLEIEKTRKTEDRLPEVLIKGADHGHSGYFMVKLPIDDPAAYLLGHITNCCQSIGGIAEACAIDSLRLQTSGVYVLLKGKDSHQPMIGKDINYKDFSIVGQGYAWLSKNNNLVLDSWENLRPETDDRVISSLLPVFAKSAIEKSSEIFRVTIGTGGKTPANLGKNALKSPETMAKGFQYCDSDAQALVYFDQAKYEAILNPLYEAWKRHGTIAEQNLTDAHQLYALDYQSYFRTRALLEEKGLHSESSRFLLHQAFRENNEFDILADIIQLLEDASLLSPQILTMLDSFPHLELFSCKKLYTALNFLLQRGIQDQDNLNLFLKIAALQTTDFEPFIIAEILITLNNADLLSANNPEALFRNLFANNSSLSILRFHLSSMADKQLLTPANLDFLAREKMTISAAENLFFLSKALNLSLKEAGKTVQHPDSEGIFANINRLDFLNLFNRENFGLLMQASLRNALTALDNIGLLDRQNCKILLQNPEQADSIASILCILHKYDLSGSENRDLLLENPQYLTAISALLKKIESLPLDPEFAKAIIQDIIENPADMDKTASWIDARILTEKMPLIHEKYRDFLLANPTYAPKIEKAANMLADDVDSLSICFHIMDKADLIAKGLLELQSFLPVDQYRYLISTPQAAELALQCGKIFSQGPQKPSSLLSNSMFNESTVSQNPEEEMEKRLQKQMEKKFDKQRDILRNNPDRQEDTFLQCMVLEMLKAYVNQEISLDALKVVLAVNPNNIKGWNSDTVRLVNDTLALSESREHAIAARREGLNGAL